MRKVRGLGQLRPHRLELRHLGRERRPRRRLRRSRRRSRAIRAIRALARRRPARRHDLPAGDDEFDFPQHRRQHLRRRDGEFDFAADRRLHLRPARRRPAGLAHLAGGWGQGEELRRVRRAGFKFLDALREELLEGEVNRRRPFRQRVLGLDAFRRVRVRGGEGEAGGICPEPPLSDKTFPQGRHAGLHLLQGFVVQSQRLQHGRDVHRAFAGQLGPPRRSLQQRFEFLGVLGVERGETLMLLGGIPLPAGIRPDAIQIPVHLLQMRQQSGERFRRGRRPRHRQMNPLRQRAGIARGRNGICHTTGRTAYRPHVKSNWRFASNY